MKIKLPSFMLLLENDDQKLNATHFLYTNGIRKSSNYSDPYNAILYREDSDEYITIHDMYRIGKYPESWIISYDTFLVKYIRDSIIDDIIENDK